MKILADKRLFWYFKDGVEIDTEDERYLDMYVKQVLSYGKESDVKKLLKEINSKTLKNSFQRIKKFLPQQVRNFWEDVLGDTE